jgi:hypothetical protein
MLPHLPGIPDQLALTAHAAFQHALASGGKRSGGRPAGEVAAVKAIVLDGFAEAAAEWTRLLAPYGYHLELRPVFVHSRPHVAFTKTDGKPGRCELADLLLVVDFQPPGGGRPDRRAVLIQAKLAKNGSIRLRRKEWVQFELLSRWPSFTFATPGYDPRARDLIAANSPGSHEVTGEYGAIQLGVALPSWTQLLVSPPDRFSGECDLGQFLATMAFGRGLCGREAEPGGRDDWSFTVDELLRVTAVLPIVKSASHLRGQSYGVGFLQVLEFSGGEPATAGGRSAFAGGGGDEPPADHGEEPWPDGPISTVQLILRGDGEFVERSERGEQRG